MARRRGRHAIRGPRFLRYFRQFGLYSNQGWTHLGLKIPTDLRHRPSSIAVHLSTPFIIRLSFFFSLSFVERFQFSKERYSKYSKFEMIENEAKSRGFNYGSIYQAKKNLHRLTLPSTFPFLAPLDAGPVPGTSRCNRLAVSHKVQVDVVPVRAAKALRAC